jgi:exodeoxyribonuclease VII large subunit
MREVVHDGKGAFQVRFAFERRLVDRIKTLPNRRWNASDKLWVIPEDDVLPLVELLADDRFRFCATTVRLYQERGGQLLVTAGPGTLFEELDAEPEVEPTTDWSVSRLNQRVREILYEALPGTLWLTGEIAGFNKTAHKRIASFHLVEREGEGTAAEVSAVLFEDTRRLLEMKLAAAGNPFRLEDEVQVRARVRVDLYVPWGAYRVVVEDLDLAYTLGEAARRREEIVRRLTVAGLIGRNTALAFPALPLRVGLITSLGSDACRDVLRTFEESGFAFRVTVHGARVQGRQTEPSVLNALDWLHQRARDFDVVLICRGGGSRTDLAWFDSELLGRAVATFPLPVLVGIGHEQDVGVLDAVGWRCKTPTAAAAAVVEAVGRTLGSLDDTASRIVQGSVGILAAAAEKLEERRRRAVRASRFSIGAAAHQLGARATEIGTCAGRHLVRRRTLLEASVRQLAQGVRRDLATAAGTLQAQRLVLAPAALRGATREAERTEARARRLHLVDPRRVLERGYALLRGQDGKALTDPAAAPAGALLRAELKGGILRVVSGGPEGDPT